MNGPIFHEVILPMMKNCRQSKAQRRRQCDCNLCWWGHLHHPHVRPRSCASDEQGLPRSRLLPLSPLAHVWVGLSSTQPWGSLGGKEGAHAGGREAGDKANMHFYFLSSYRLLFLQVLFCLLVLC